MVESVVFKTIVYPDFMDEIEIIEGEELPNKFNNTPVEPKIDLVDFPTQDEIEKSFIMELAVPVTELKYLVAIVPNYPIQRKGKIIHTCTLYFHKPVNAGLTKYDHPFIIGTAGTIAKIVKKATV